MTRNATVHWEGDVNQGGGNVDRAATRPRHSTPARRSRLRRSQAAGLAISRVDLNVRGRVPGLDADGFEQAAREAEQACAVSNALRGNVQINVNAELEGG